MNRTRELEAIRQLLLDDGVRLLTLVGPAGIGKTRLALATARGLQRQFPHGVRFVDLAPSPNGSSIERPIAKAFDLNGVAAHRLLGRVSAYLRKRHVLLVIDNFEHVMRAASQVADLLGACPRLKVLVTSREPLSLHWEHRFPIPRMALPSLSDLDPEKVSHTASAALFIERVRAIRPGFALTRDNVRAIAELLVRLDGSPLAIEIAAAQSATLSPTAMLKRLQGDTLLSAEDLRDAPARHHTLRQAIEWSYDLLDGAGQRVFSRLGIFVHDWTLDAAEYVVGPDQPGRRILGILGSLVDKSLIDVQDPGYGERRYRMPAAIKEYALERLRANQETADTQRRYTAYYLALAERAESELRGPGQHDWCVRLEQEHENLRTALRWAAESGAVVIEARLTGALARFWRRRGYLSEGWQWLEGALAHGGAVPPPYRVKLLEGAGTIALTRGDYAKARELLQESLVLAEKSRDPARIGIAVTELGVAASREGEFVRAIELQEKGLSLLRQAGDPWGIAFAMKALGKSLLGSGELGRAQQVVDEAFDCFGKIGDKHQIALTMTTLAELRLLRHDEEGAAALVVESLKLSREVDDRRAAGYAVMIAAFLAFTRGRVHSAIRLLAAVDAWGKRTGTVVAWRHREHKRGIDSAARMRLGDQAYGAAVAEGRALSVDEAIDLALGRLPADSRTRADGGEGRGDHSTSPLTDREREVLRLISEGFSNKQIARALSITIRTVKTHVASILAKLGAENRAHAIALALQEKVSHRQ